MQKISFLSRPDSQVPTYWYPYDSYIRDLYLIILIDNTHMIHSDAIRGNNVQPYDIIVDTTLLQIWLLK